MKRIIILLVAMTMAVTSIQQAHAQAFPNSMTGTGRTGIIIPAWNTVDSVIFNGEIVMIDTTATVKRFGVRRYDGGLANRVRVVGIAATDFPKSSRGGSGSVLIWGYHDRAHAVKAMAAGQVLKIGAINGSLATAGDSLGMGVARVVRGVAGATNKDNARYGVWWFGIGGGKID